MGNSYEGVALALVVEPVARREWQPVETVSNSEAGFERVYQGSCLTVRWPLRLARGKSARFTVEWRANQSRDHAVEEAAGRHAPTDVSVPAV
jgi:hypothetical protein